MKKIVFLFLLIVSITFTDVGAQTTFKEDAYTVTLTPYRNEYNKIAYHVEKLGQNPFAIDWNKGEEELYFNGVSEINGEHLFYGSIHSGPEENRVFDAYALLVSKTGEVIDEFSIDCGHDEHLLKVFMMDELILFQVWSNDEFNRDQVQFFTELRTYDYEYNLIDSLRYDEYYYHTRVEDDNYYFGTGPNFDRGMVNSDLEIFYEDDSLKIETGTVYQNEVTIPIINTAVLNGRDVHNAINIAYPGNYSLLYNGFNYKFVVDTKIEGVEDGGVYDETVAPTISIGNATLNGEQFISGTSISKPGNYSIVVEGESGYRKNAQFTISSSVSGILNNTTYTDDVTIEFDGEGYLNNVHMTSPIRVSDKGEYTLKIQGENDYYESYYFTLEDDINKTSFLSFVQTYDVVFLAVVVVAGYFILKKKK